MTYKLLKPILEYKIGTILRIEGENGILGTMPWGWEIPLFIIQRNPETFELIL